MGTAAAAAKLLQLCLTLCDPIDSSPPGSWDSQGKNTGVGCHCLLQNMGTIKGKSGMDPKQKQKMLRRGSKNTQKNYTKKILMTQITTMVLILT